MDDKNRPHEELVEELQRLRIRVAQLEKLEAGHREAEETLLENEELLRILINATPDIVCFKDGQGRWIEANEANLKLFELDGVEYKYKKDSELAQYSDFYRDAFLTCEVSDEKAWQKRVLSRTEEIIPLPDGTIKIYDVIKVPLFHPDGSRKGLVVLGRDITEIKNAEVALRESKRHLEKRNMVLWELAKTRAQGGFDRDDMFRQITQATASIIKSERVSIWLLSDDCSKICCKDLYEHTKNQHDSGMELESEKYPGYFSALKQERMIAADDARNDPRTKEFTESYLIPLGITSMMDTPIWLSGRMLGILCCEHVGKPRTWRMEDKNFAGVMADLISLVIEESEHKKIEKDLRIQKNLLQTIMKSIPDLIVLKDTEFRYQSVNSAFCKFVGKTEEELIGKTDYDVFPYEEASHCRQVDQQALESNMKLVEDQKKIGFDCVKWFQVAKTPIVDSNGVVTGLLCSLRDITNRKQAERELAKKLKELARTNDELEQFAYVTSHDLQEPLRVVTGFVALLVRRYKHKLDSEDERIISAILNGINRMHTLINDLLEYSRVGMKGITFEKVNCCELLDNVRADLGAAIDENKAVVSNDPLPVLVANEVLLRQLFQNLISNALKFRSDEPPRVHIHAEKIDNEWCFYVKDNGIGIDTKYFKRIFVIFKRLHTKTEYPGTGIGLALCKKIVDCHNGRIWLESQKGAGSTFYFTIPIIGEHNYG